MFKNDAESSLFELLCDVFSKFSKQRALCLVSHVHFLFESGITGCIKFPLHGMRRFYVNMASANQF